MRSLRKSLARAWILILVCALGAGTTQAIEVTHNLAADAQIAAQQSKPLLLFFTQPGCPYCERARAEYLRHLAVDPGYTARAVFREISVGAGAALILGFDGQRRTSAAVARAQGVKLFPTIVIVDAAGRQLADPLRGFTVPDFYAAAIDTRLEQAQRLLGKAP